MPKFNVDEKIFEPIELTLNGKEYKLTEVSREKIKKVQEIGKAVKEGGAENTDNLSAAARQLGVLLDVNPKEFDNVDMRKLGAAIRFITETVTEQIQGKNG